MSRFTLLLVIGLVVMSAKVDAANPNPLADTITQARNLLAQNMPGAAVATLEAQLAAADGDREFLDLLRTAYQAEVRLLTSQKAEPQRINAVQTKLALLGGAPADTPLPLPVVVPGTTPPALTPPATPSPAPVAQPTAARAEPAGADILKQAAALFNQAKSSDPKKYLDASKLFGLAFSQQVQMRKDQLAAWAYCRVKLAADQLNKSTDARTAAEVVQEVEAALALAPDHQGLQSAGQDVLTVARQRAGKNLGSRPPAAAGATTIAGWQTIETDSFRISYQGNHNQAETIGRVAEAKRTEIASKWSGPLGGPWKPKCEIVLHPGADAFARATHLSNAATGRAEIKLKDGQPISRRIDLRADDERCAEDALPRELTHVLLADLFWDQPPPKWAEIGMSVMSASEMEVSRHLRTVPRCARNRELPAVADVLKATEVPTTALTGYYVESVSLVEYLVSLKGEKAFTSFIRDTQRYGTDAALKRQYGLTDSRQLEENWRKAAIGQ